MMSVCAGQKLPGDDEFDTDMLIMRRCEAHDRVDSLDEQVCTEVHKSVLGCTIVRSLVRFNASSLTAHTHTHTHTQRWTLLRTRVHSNALLCTQLHKFSSLADACTLA